MTDVKELNEETKELIERIELLKKNLKNSMMRGEARIVKGIIIFETIVKELNPSTLDENTIDKIEECTRRYLIEKEELTQHVDAYVNYGVNRCFLILEMYRKNKNKKLTKKDKILFTFD